MHLFYLFNRRVFFIDYYTKFEMFKELISKKKPSFEIGEITRPEKPLFTVAEGCLIAAEFHEIKETK